ncbi:calpastatin-like isoform X6 [Anguilla anguilla]|uniref:calpastatin-like isoform X6 n=1 Tax=Anguilla anguilla TaxID=7936 RepID=UPI0015B20BFA|nr:calpastatin-like isoform X6 [Anguilla anguilla]
MPSKSRKHSRKRRRQAQRKAQAAAQVGPGGTPAAPSVAPVANGCPAPAEVVKIEDAVVNKARVSGPLHAPGPRLTRSNRPVYTDLESVPVEKTNDSPQVVPKSLSNDGALEALSAGFTKSAPIAPAEEPGSVPLDALNALSDILGSQEPEPEPPKIDPADIISERTLVTEEEAVLVGEDEDTIPPDYRFTENGTDLPPPKEEPSMDSGAALDILSGDFAAVPGAPPKQPCLEALDMLDGDFAAPAQAEEVQTDIPANQTSTDETLGVISCGPSAAIPSDTAVQALVEDAPAIADLSGNMVQAQS